NAPAIRASNGTTLKNYADLILRSLPPHSAIVLSDNPYLNLLLEARQSGANPSERHVVLDQRTLGYKAYQMQLQKRAPSILPSAWGDLLKQRGIDDPIGEELTLQLIWYFERNNEVYLLTPSVGKICESMYLRPQGLAYRLKEYGTNTGPPVLTAAEID